MGQLVEQPIKTIFNGVSRQPHTVRQLGQVEEADNVLLSVVTGGFEKRPGTQHIGELNGASPSTDYAVHAIDRDSSEQYLVMIPGDGTILVYDAQTGAQKTVNSLSADAINYLTASSYEAFAFVSVVDYTVIVNREIVVAKTYNAEWLNLADGAGTLTSDMTNPTNAFDTNPATSATKLAATSAHLTKDWGAGTERYVTRAVVTGLVNVDTVTLQYSDDGVSYFSLETAVPSGGAVDIWKGFIAAKHRYSRLLFTKSVAATITVGDVEFYDTSIKGAKQNFTALPATPTAGDIWEVAGDTSTNFDNYYMKGDGSVWRDTVSPMAHNTFDAITMPYTLIRQADGTFTLQKAVWAPRATGDDIIAPFPSCLGKTISDVFFHRNRLGFLSDEFCIFSQSGDYFNLWPEKSTQVLDSDGFEKAASTNKVTLLKWAVPFRRSLFVTSDKSQFEVSSLDKFAPSTAEIDLSTTYEASPNCRPAAMGDTLYFPSNYGGHTVMWEYFWDDDKFSSSASDITKHCETYVPQELRQLASVPASDRLYARSTQSGETDKLYVYTTYWDGTEKLQSAWCKFNFPDATVRGIACMSDYLYTVMARNGHVYLEKMTATTETNDPDLGYAVMLDRRIRLTGTYDEVNDWTNFTLPFVHNNDLVSVMSGDWSDTPGRRVEILSYPSSTTCRLRGNFGGVNRMYFGKTYTMSVELSKQAIRDAQGASIIAGRCQINRMTVSYRNTGYFRVEITPERRDTKTVVMPGALLGSGDLVNVPLIIEHGVFGFRVNSKSDTVQIVFKNDSHTPSTITSISWLGFFTELSRQE